MRARMQVHSERLARGPAGEQWARIDPVVYLAEGRRRQAQAIAEAIGAGARALRWGLTSVAALLRRQLLEPLARRAARKRAIGRLAELEDRLLADIGLRRGDIELAVDGLLADPRVTRRSSGAAAPVAERLRHGAQCPAPTASAHSNPPVATAQREHVRERAA